MPDARDPRAAFILEGVGSDEVIGDFGLAGGGAAGYEIDRYDLALGTPPNALLLATSLDHSVNYPHVCEEIMFNYPGLDGTNDFMVRADLVYFTTRDGGAVFSTSSIAWCGSALAQRLRQQRLADHAQRARPLRLLRAASGTRCLRRSS